MASRSPAENAAYMKEYRKRRKVLGIPIKDAPSWEENQRNRYRRYGLTESSYLALYAQQCGCCAICRQPIKEKNTKEDRTFNTHIDHCHTSGKVRGLLCSGCNLGLGHFKDDADRLQRAAGYLKP
jgi:hypothetical protein